MFFSKFSLFFELFNVFFEIFNLFFETFNVFTKIACSELGLADIKLQNKIAMGSGILKSFKIKVHTV